MLVVVVVEEGSVVVVVVFSTVTGGMSSGSGTVVVLRGLSGLVVEVVAVVVEVDRALVALTGTGVAGCADGRSDRVITSPSTVALVVGPGAGPVSRYGPDPRCAWTSVTVATMATKVIVIPAHRRRCRLRAMCAAMCRRVSLAACAAGNDSEWIGGAGQQFRASPLRGALGATKITPM